MVLWILDDIEDVVAEGLEVIFPAELAGTGFELIVWLLEGEEVAEHVHDGFLWLPLGDVPDALSDPPHFSQLPQVEVVLQLDAHIPGVDQKFTDNVSGDEVGECCDDICAKPIVRKHLFCDLTVLEVRQLQYLLQDMQRQMRFFIHYLS